MQLLSLSLVFRKEKTQNVSFVGHRHRFWCLGKVVVRVDESLIWVRVSVFEWVWVPRLMDFGTETMTLKDRIFWIWPRELIHSRYLRVDILFR